MGDRVRFRARLGVINSSAVANGLCGVFSVFDAVLGAVTLDTHRAREHDAFTRLTLMSMRISMSAKTVPSSMVWLFPSNILPSVRSFVAPGAQSVDLYSQDCRP